MALASSCSRCARVFLVDMKEVRIMVSEWEGERQGGEDGRDGICGRS